MVLFINYFNPIKYYLRSRENHKLAIETIGATLVQISLVIKQDQTLGMEIIKLLKVANGVSSSFRIALALTISRIHRFETSVKLKEYIF